MSVKTNSAFWLSTKKIHNYKPDPLYIGKSLLWYFEHVSMKSLLMNKKTVHTL